MNQNKICNRCIKEKELIDLGPLKNDPRYLGCSKDVSKELQKFCNKKPKCEMKVTDLEKESDDFCLTGLNKHLKVSYSCLKSSTIK